jgi:hypothetical protein
VVTPIALDFWPRVLLLAVPTAFILAGAGSLLRLAWFHRRSVSVPGTIVGFQEVKDGDGDTLYRAVVRFTAEGREWEVGDYLAHGWHSHREGQAVRVHYLPGDPARGRIWRAWYPALFVGAVVAGVVLLGVVSTRL